MPLRVQLRRAPMKVLLCYLGVLLLQGVSSFTISTAVRVQHKTQLYSTAASSGSNSVLKEACSERKLSKDKVLQTLEQLEVSSKQQITRAQIDSATWELIWSSQVSAASFFCETSLIQLCSWRRTTQPCNMHLAAYYVRGILQYTLCATQTKPKPHAQHAACLLATLYLRSVMQLSKGYMPVKELIKFDLEQQKVELNTSFGPLPLGGVRGLCKWGSDASKGSKSAAVVSFCIDKVVFGPLEINKGGKNGEPLPSKTYTFFYLLDGIAAARSSAGGIALLQQQRAE
jgi:hypothetical protein